MINPMRRTLYKLNEGNANNPANLLVGDDVKVIKYDPSGTNKDEFVGTIDLITNTEVVVTDSHTDDCYNFQFNGFNAHENGIEFVNDSDPDLRFYVY